jgi:hypothetical protein
MEMSAREQARRQRALFSDFAAVQDIDFLLYFLSISPGGKEIRQG